MDKELKETIKASMQSGPNSDGGDVAKVRAIDAESGKKVDEAALAAKLAETFPQDEDADLRVEDEKPASPKEEKAPAEKPTSSPAGTEKKDEEAEKPSKEAKTEETTSSEEEEPPVLDAVTVRALKRKGYTDDDIKTELEDDPKSFAKLARYISRETAQEDLRAAQAASRQQQTSPPPTAPPLMRPPSDAAQPGQQLTAADLSALRERYKRQDGQPEPLIEALIAQHQQLQAIVPQIEEARQYQARAQNESLVRMIDSVFADPQNAAVHDALGKDRASLTAEQWQARNEVVKQADAIYRGYGGAITHTEALQRSIDVHAAQNAKKAAIAQVTEELKQRRAGATLKPRATSGAGRREEAKPSTAQQLRDKVRSKLKSVFGGA